MTYKIPETPLPIYIKGFTKEYQFSAYNIGDKIENAMPGVYIFTKTIKDNRSNIIVNAHIFISFASVKKEMNNIIEIVKQAKENGAKHFLYYASYNEKDRQDVILDIKEGEDYKYHLENTKD